MNISKETTYRELCKMRGIPEHVQREIGINLTGGVANAVEICHNAFKLPTPEQWLDSFMEDKKRQVA